MTGIASVDDMRRSNSLSSLLVAQDALVKLVPLANELRPVVLRLGHRQGEDLATARERLIPRRLERPEYALRVHAEAEIAAAGARQ